MLHFKTTHLKKWARQPDLGPFVPPERSRAARGGEAINRGTTGSPDAAAPVGFGSGGIVSLHVNSPFPWKRCCIDGAIATNDPSL